MFLKVFSVEPRPVLPLVIRRYMLTLFETDAYHPLFLVDKDLEESLWDIFRLGFERMASYILCVEAGGKAALSHPPSRSMDACWKNERKQMTRDPSHEHMKGVFFLSSPPRITLILIYTLGSYCSTCIFQTTMHHYFRIPVSNLTDPVLGRSMAL